MNSTDPHNNEQARQLRAGDRCAPRVLRNLADESVAIPDAAAIVHLQFRRFAGCPICSLHLRSFAQRADELRSASIREVAVFHSSADELRKVHTRLPFDVVPDPSKALYRAFGVGASPRAILDPRVWLTAARAVAARASSDPTAGRDDGTLGLPGDFLIAQDGRIIAVKYGVHADDQWSIDEVLALVAGGRS